MDSDRKSLTSQWLVIVSFMVILATAGFGIVLLIPSSGDRCPPSGDELLAKGINNSGLVDQLPRDSAFSFDMKTRDDDPKSMPSGVCERFLAAWQSPDAASPERIDHFEVMRADSPVVAAQVAVDRRDRLGYSFDTIDGVYVSQPSVTIFNTFSNQCLVAVVRGGPGPEPVLEFPQLVIDELAAIVCVEDESAQE